MIVGIVNNQTKIILGIVTILIMIGTGMMIGCTTVLLIITVTIPVIIPIILPVIILIIIGTGMIGSTTILIGMIVWIMEIILGTK